MASIFISHSSKDKEFVRRLASDLRELGAQAESMQSTDLSQQISALVAKIQSRSSPLAQCIAEALPIAQSSGEMPFERFCRNELTGWSSDDGGARGPSPSYREISAFVSPFGEINAAYMGWGGDLSNALDHMRSDKKNYFPYTLIVTQPVAQIESDPSSHSPKSLLTFRLKQRDLLKDTKTPDATVIAYARGDSHLMILEGIRRELTHYLLSLLPQGILR